MERFPTKRRWERGWRDSLRLDLLMRRMTLDSLTFFPSFTTQSTNSITQIIIHRKNLQFMERLAFFFLSQIPQPTFFQTENHENRYPIIVTSLPLTFSLCWRFAALAFPQRNSPVFIDASEGKARLMLQNEVLDSRLVQCGRTRG